MEVTCRDISGFLVERDRVHVRVPRGPGPRRAKNASTLISLLDSGPLTLITATSPSPSPDYTLEISILTSTTSTLVSHRLSFDGPRRPSLCGVGLVFLDFSQDSRIVRAVELSLARRLDLRTSQNKTTFDSSKVDGSYIGTIYHQNSTAGPLYPSKLG